MNLSQNIFILQDFNSLIFRNKNDKKCSWDLANKVNISDLEKREKRSQIISYDICFIHTYSSTCSLLIGAYLSESTTTFVVFIDFCTSVLVVNSFASYYKNRMWRNEVYLKKRERLRHNVGFF
jgi:hypothetical protein